MSACIDTPEQIDRFRIICIKQGLQMYAKFKMLPTRNVSATQLLTMASAVTGKAYKRGQHAIAAADVAAILDGRI